MATLVRWEPFREMASLHNELSRMMNGLLEGNGGSGQSWVPAVDVWETEREVVYAFDLPGIPQDAISLEVEKDALTVSAERERADEVDGERFYRFERRFGAFTRTVGLPQGIDPDGVKAEYHDGVLEVHVPKPEGAKPRRIEIAGGDGKQRTIEGESTTK
jgi:HSP20 family protein